MRKFRIILASVMLVASLLWLGLGADAPKAAEISERVQIIPSAIKSCMGTTAIWLIATLLFGRIYCSTVCPIGTLQDISVIIRRKTGKGVSFGYKKEKNARYVILIIYLASLAAGMTVAGYLIEPWNIMRNAASAFRPADTASTWGMTGLPLGIGMAAGLAAVAVILVWAWMKGKDFCTDVCPLGAAMGCLHTQTLMSIAIDVDRCTSCMKCENICSAKCIKVSERYVDNSRCLRCFDCVSVCNDGAIRFQINKDRQRQTPMLIEN